MSFIVDAQKYIARLGAAFHGQDYRGVSGSPDYGIGTYSADVGAMQDSMGYDLGVNPYDQLMSGQDADHATSYDPLFNAMQQLNDYRLEVPDMRNDAMHPFQNQEPVEPGYDYPQGNWPETGGE